MTKISHLSELFINFGNFHQQKQPKLGNCDTRDKIFKFCEAFDGFLESPVRFQLAFNNNNNNNNIDLGYKYSMR